MLKNFAHAKTDKSNFMDYHIYLDGEKCGELTNAEHEHLRKSVSKDARTWLAFGLAQIAATGRFFNIYFKMLAALGGLLFLIAAMLAPSFWQAIQGQSGEEIAHAIRHLAIYSTVLAVFLTAILLVMYPQRLGIPDVFKHEFVRRVRLLKDIHRYGQLEVIGFTLPTSEGGNKSEE